MRSRSFITTDKFEIGRYVLTSVVSRPAFLTIGVYADGKWTATSERLNSSVKYDAIKWMTCFKTDAGIGSTADDLSGHCRPPSMTSSTLTDGTAANAAPGWMRLKVGRWRHSCLSAPLKLSLRRRLLCALASFCMPTISCWLRRMFSVCKHTLLNLET